MKNDTQIIAHTTISWKKKKANKMEAVIEIHASRKYKDFLLKKNFSSSFSLVNSYFTFI